MEIDIHERKKKTYSQKEIFLIGSNEDPCGEFFGFSSSFGNLKTHTIEILIGSSEDHC